MPANSSTVMGCLGIAVGKASHVLGSLEALQALADDFPAFFRIRDAHLPHRPLVHPCKHRIGQLEHIRQPLLGVNFRARRTFSR